MALTSAQFDYFTGKLDVMEPDLDSVKTAVEAAAVDLAALETLVTATNTKLDTVISALAILDTTVATTDTNIVAALGDVSLGDGVLTSIRDELVGVRNFPSGGG